MLRTSRRLLTTAVMSATVAALALAGSGVAGASTGPAEISPEQAGYTVTGLSFTQARIGTDFGTSPWDGSYSHAPPAKSVKVAAFSNATLITYSGHTSSLVSWWVHHPLLANTGQQSDSDWVAVPTGLSSSGSGSNFSTYFVPQSGQGPNQPARP